MSWSDKENNVVLCFNECYRLEEGVTYNYRDFCDVNTLEAEYKEDAYTSTVTPSTPTDSVVEEVEEQVNNAQGTLQGLENMPYQGKYEGEEIIIYNIIYNDFYSASISQQYWDPMALWTRNSI